MDTVGCCLVLSVDERRFGCAFGKEVTVGAVPCCWDGLLGRDFVLLFGSCLGCLFEKGLLLLLSLLLFLLLLLLVF